MNTEEVIDFLDDVFSKCKLKECNLQNLNKIVYLLMQGEKYKRIIDELKNDFGDGIVENPYNGIGCKLSQMIEIIGQKYFPEEANQGEWRKIK